MAIKRGWGQKILNLLGNKRHGSVMNWQGNVEKIYYRKLIFSGLYKEGF